MMFIYWFLRVSGFFSYWFLCGLLLIELLCFIMHFNSIFVLPSSSSCCLFLECLTFLDKCDNGFNFFCCSRNIFIFIISKRFEIKLVLAFLNNSAAYANVCRFWTYRTTKRASGTTYQYKRFLYWYTRLFHKTSQ